jgi:hypothetical protein
MKTLILKFSVCLLLIFGVACKPIPKMAGDSSASTSGQSSAGSTIILPKKTATPTIAIDWISPSAADLNITEVNGKILVKIKISSKTPISVDQINITVNGIDVKNKADEVTINQRKEVNDNMVSMYVPIASGSNFTKLVYTSPDGTKYVAERNIDKTNNGIKVKTDNVNGSTKIFWTAPDPFKIGKNVMFTTKNKELEIQLRITTSDVLKKEDFKVLLNGLYLYPSSKAELLGSGGEYSFRETVSLSDKKDVNEVGIKIFGKSGVSESDRMSINFTAIRPNLYVLSIGPKTSLSYTVNDAQDFARLYKNQGKTAGSLFNSVTVDSLLGKRATASEIRKAISKIETKLSTNNITEDDVIMVFISTHGLTEGSDLWLQGDDYDANVKSETTVSYQNNILKPLANLPCKKLVFIDACHSGLGSKGASAQDVNIALQSLRNAPRGLAVIASSKGSEESHEDLKWNNGAFTEAIVKGLKDGKADKNNNKVITINELFSYISEEVPSMVFEVKSKQQHPQITRNELGDDFPIYIIK